MYVLSVYAKISANIDVNHDMNDQYGIYILSSSI